MITSKEFIDSLILFGVGLRKLDDDLFSEDKPPPRWGIYDEDDEDMYHSVINTICSVPGCSFTSQSLLDFENHYNSNHRYACSVCKKNQPSPHLLDLHIQETHDSFFAVLAAKKPSYCCYIEECKEKFQTPDMRLEHCVTIHKLPKDFRFDKKPKQHKKKKIQKNNHIDVKGETDKHSFNLNNSKSKTFTTQTFKKFTSDSQQNITTVDIDEVMSELKESLPT